VQVRHNLFAHLRLNPRHAFDMQELPPPRASPSEGNETSISAYPQARSSLALSVEVNPSIFKVLISHKRPFAAIQTYI